MNSVFLLVLGSGFDGDERSVEAIYSTREKAERAYKRWLRDKRNCDRVEVDERVLDWEGQ